MQENVAVKPEPLLPVVSLDQRTCLKSYCPCLAGPKLPDHPDTAPFVPSVKSVFGIYELMSKLADMEKVNVMQEYIFLAYT